MGVLVDTFSITRLSLSAYTFLTIESHRFDRYVWRNVKRFVPIEIDHTVNLLKKSAKKMQMA